MNWCRISQPSTVCYPEISEFGDVLIFLAEDFDNLQPSVLIPKSFFKELWSMLRHRWKPPDFLATGPLFLHPNGAHQVTGNPEISK